MNPYVGVLIKGVSNVTLTDDGRPYLYETGALINNSKNVEISDMNYRRWSIYVGYGLIRDTIDKNYLFTNIVGIKFRVVNGSLISNNFYDSNDISAISIFDSGNNMIGNNTISSGLNVYLLILKI